MKLRNWTPFVFAFPKRYLSTSDTVTNLDLQTWSETEYEWEQDEWNGYADFLTAPEKTVESGRGDCEDYAFVAASWAHRRYNNVQIAICFNDGNPIPRHMVAWFNGDVYSSGTIHKDTSISEYVADSQYDWHLTRDV